MKRLQTIAEWLYDNSRVSVSKKTGGWDGYILWIYPDEIITKISISCETKPNKKMQRKLAIAEIKLRLQDIGWDKCSFRRFLNNIYYDKIIVKDDFSKRNVTLEGYRFRGESGLYNDFSGALYGYMGIKYWEAYCGHKA